MAIILATMWILFYSLFLNSPRLSNEQQSLSHKQEWLTPKEPATLQNNRKLVW